MGIIPYIFPCPKCGKFEVIDGKVQYLRLHNPYQAPEPVFSYKGEECEYCPSCHWHSETESQRQERLYGEGVGQEERLKRIEEALKIEQHNTWVAGNQAASNRHNLYRISQGQRPIIV